MNSCSKNTDHRSELSRAQGCFLGQLLGDGLGSLVEFQSPEEPRCSYPNGVRELADGGTWNTIAGQLTDDSEMLLLVRILTERSIYDVEAIIFQGFQRAMKAPWSMGVQGESEVSL
ncbi:ADP-ribosylglycohydrolase [Nitrosomonas ureae]|uniref:ADP-ribosylglycohydrolase n=1 Tax=Nitrosomonas ureae TaxID=44577 RepID=A0A285C196_9PROT|nr:ADP-ribosylglycohydrolase family protein [Nitrosomonas ureae]SNX61240.1 ADP-ribosylglycohydrolase [Nitrosomonas ureae]